MKVYGETGKVTLFKAKAQCKDEATNLVFSAVRQVQAENIHASEKELFNHLFVESLGS